MAGLASNTSIDRVSAARDSGTHFPGHLHVLPGDLNAFRKPTTTNPAEPQYISNHVWNEALLKAQSAHTATRRSGRQTLTRYKHAARVQETEEGKAAVRPCRHCAPYKRTYVCRVYQDASSSGLLSCGCCLSCGKPGCCAGEEKKYIGEEACSLREYMDEIKKQYNNFIEHEEERSAASEQRPTLLEDRCETLLNAIRTQFEERLRAIEDHFQDLEQRHRALEDHSQNRSERLTAVEKRFNTLDRLTWQEDASLHSSYVPLYRHRLSPCSDPAKYTRIASTLEALSKDRPADP